MTCTDFQRWLDDGKPDTERSRMTGHSAHDDADYVPKELFRAAEKKDPLPRFEKWLLAKKIVTPKQVRKLEGKIKTELADAVAFAESSPMPDGAEAPIRVRRPLPMGEVD